MLKALDKAGDKVEVELDAEADQQAIQHAQKVWQAPFLPADEAQPCVAEQCACQDGAPLPIHHHVLGKLHI